MSETKLRSPEADIDQQMEDLIEKIVSGDATPEDRHKYQELSMRRFELMQPRAPIMTRAVRGHRLKAG